MSPPSRILPARHEMFARQFALCGKIAEAYFAAFPEEQHVSQARAYAKGYAMLQCQGVKARARVLRDEAALDVMEVTRILASHFADVLQAPRDVVQHRRGACRHCHGDGHRYHWRETEYLARLDEVENLNRTRGKGAETPLPDPAGGFGYDEAETPHTACPACNGRGVGYTYVKDTSSLSPEEEAAFEGIEITDKSVKPRYMSKSEAAAGLMKLYGIGADTLRLIMPAPTKAIPEIPDDPIAAAEAYRQLMLRG